MRRAFTSVVNRTTQFDLMMRMFQRANLNELKVHFCAFFPIQSTNFQLLDLSYNYLNSLPYQLACPFPSLSKLDLRQNLLKTVSLNTSCLEKVDLVDLSRNHFHELDANFRNKFADFLPAHSLELKNSFYCDCKSVEYIQWIRATNMVVEDFVDKKRIILIGFRFEKKAY